MLALPARLGASMSLELRPVPVRAACDVWVKKLHRHLPRVVGGLFAVTVWEAGELVGVGVASLPKARMSRDGFTVEISRVATDGHENACSRIYAALCRACAAIGVRKVKTFTRPEEPGVSLRAAGFTDEGLTEEESWDRPKRPRKDEPKVRRRWTRQLQEPRLSRVNKRRLRKAKEAA